MKDRDLVGQRMTGRWIFLCSMAGDMKGESVLNVACGAGWFEAHALAQGCARVVGVENSPALVEKLGRELPGAEILLLDATRGLAGLGNFDTVCAFDFLEHLPGGGETGFLREAAALLEPGGRVLLSVPYLSFLSNLLDPAFYFGHRHYNYQRMERLLRLAGLEPVREVYAGGLWEQLSLIWLYIFKWMFRREMPFADYLEGRRRAEYQRWSTSPGPRAFSTMFIEARPPAGFC